MDLNDTIPGMTSEDYKERFKAEFQQTAIRAARLYKILDLVNRGEAPNCFKPTCPISILEEQYIAMIKYLTILKLRARYENIDLEEVTI